MGFLNRTDAEIGYKFDVKNAIKSFFIIEKIKKYRKCPALIIEHDELNEIYLYRLFVSVVSVQKSLAFHWPD